MSRKTDRSSMNDIELCEWCGKGPNNHLEGICPAQPRQKYTLTSTQQRFLDLINKTAEKLPGNWILTQSWGGIEGADLYLEDFQTGDTIAFRMDNHRHFNWIFATITNPNDDDFGKPRGSDFSADARRGAASLIRTLEQVLQSRRKHQYPYR